MQLQQCSCRFLIALAVISVLFFAGEIDGGNRPPVPAKRYKVDLDVEPMLRWNPVLKNFDYSLVMNALNALAKKYLINKEIFALAEMIAADIDKYLGQPYADELRGIAKFYGGKLGDAVLANIAYDLSAWNKKGGEKSCTSIVAVDKYGGIIHGRDMDYDIDASEPMRHITIEVEVHRSGKTLFVGTTFVGFIGFVTSSKPKAFSLSCDQRNTGPWWDNLLYAMEGAWPSTLMAREVITKANSYDEAIDMLSRAKTISPMYYILSGLKPHEGAILVHDRWGALNVTRMTDAHKWFVVETNYDPWDAPPADDNRRDPAIKLIKNVGQDNMDAENLYKVMSTQPVLNADTVYTTIMSAANISMYRTMLRYDDPPDHQ